MKHKILEQLSACAEAVKWASQYNTLNMAWDKCVRGDWMMWYASKSKDPDCIARLRGCACEIARLSKKETTIWLADHTSGYAAVAGVVAFDFAYAAALASFPSKWSCFLDFVFGSFAIWFGGRPPQRYTNYELVEAVRIKVLADCADIVRRHFPVVPVVEL